VRIRSSEKLSAFDLGDDVLGGGFPDEWFWVVIPVFGPRGDGIGDLGHAGEHAAAEASLSSTTCTDSPRGTVASICLKNRSTSLPVWPLRRSVMTCPVATFIAANRSMVPSRL
jgi:hypothetical protein